MDYHKMAYKSAYALRNPLTGRWLVFGQQGAAAPYIADKNQAMRMLLTVDHYNRTGEIETFALADAKKAGIIFSVKK